MEKQKYKKLILSGNDRPIYYDVELSFLPNNLVLVTGWRRHFLFKDQTNPKKYPDWPKEKRQSCMEWLFSKPGTIEYYSVIYEYYTEVEFITSTNNIYKATL